MTFAEKLVFLMNITSTSNKQLAGAAFVDPSFISLLRTARREAPKSMKLTRGIADYLARKCESGYQRNALAEAMGRRDIDLHMSAEQLAAVLFDWLSDRRVQTGRLAEGRRDASLVEPRGTDTADTPEGRRENDASVLYYGSEGKRAALDAFLTELSALPEVGTVLLSTDENLDWLTQDAAYGNQLQERIRLLLEKGFRVRRIAAPVHSTEQIFDKLSHLLPLYLTARVESFYYPRLRDNVHRRTIIALPNAAALSASSLGAQGESRVTLFTRDKRLVNALADEFSDYLDKCKPVMTVHSTQGQLQGLLRCVERFEAETGTRIQMSTSLSAITTPPELIPLALHALPPQEAAAVADTLLRAESLFRQSLDSREAVDIHCLASAQEVRDGCVPISVSHFGGEPPAYYNAKSYVLHLKSILEHMRKFPNYRAVFRPRDEQLYTALTKDGRPALLFRAGSELSLFEVCQPNATELIREHMERLTEETASPAAQRDSAMEWILAMIRELEG